jgi:osmoprotectant transport system permease protein
MLLTRAPKISGAVIGLASVMQTIPALALLAIMIPIFGIGSTPAIVALFIYSLLPILRNTYLGLTSVDPALIDAAKGMGMNSFQRMWKVELQLALPVIMAGVRLSATYVIAWTALASYIGAGGLGDLIFNGLNLYRSDLILGGSIPVIILALVADFLLGKLEAKLTPKTTQEVG